MCKHQDGHARHILPRGTDPGEQGVSEHVFSAGGSGYGVCDTMAERGGF